MLSVPVGRELVPPIGYAVPPVGNRGPPPTVTVRVAVSVWVTVISWTGGQVAPLGEDVVYVGELADVDTGGNPESVLEGLPGKVEGRLVEPGPYPVGNIPVGYTPVGNTPVGYTPVGYTPVGYIPVGYTPVGDAPVGTGI